LGTIIKNSQFNADVLNKSSIPIVLCSSTQRVNKIIAESHYYELSLNNMLAESLVGKDAATRPKLVNDEIMKIVDSVHVPILLMDYEMLFDPRYNIDVIRLFYELSRRVKIVIRWCGRNK